MLRNRKISLKVHFVETGYISFLLLVFFVIFMSINTRVRSTKNVVSLLESRVPDIKSLKPRDVLNLNLYKTGRLTVDGEVVEINQLKSIAKEFIDNPDNQSNKPEKGWQNIPYFGPMLITLHHVIHLEYDKNSSFGAYMAVRRELKAAYFELRDKLAERKWQKKYKTLLKDEKQAVRMIYPQQISENMY